MSTAEQLAALSARLRNGGWDLRSPQELADIIASHIDAIRHSTTPAQAPMPAPCGRDCHAVVDGCDYPECAQHTKRAAEPDPLDDKDSVFYSREPLPQAPAQAAEPLFLLHCGQIDSSGEQDDWDCQADSWKRVEEFCSLHPGRTVPLYAAPYPSEPAATGRVGLTQQEVVALFVELNARCVTAETPTEMFAVIVRAVEAKHNIPAPTGSAAPTGEA